MTRRSTTLIAGLLALIALTGCAPSGGSSPTVVSADKPDNLQTAVYREIDGSSLKADVCLPKAGGDKPAPAVILLHGGGFEEGSRANMRSLCGQFAARGFVGVAIDYRLLPENSYPKPIEDAEAAVAWLSSPDVSSKYGVDPTRIGMLGSSAGAIITATLAARADSGLAAAVALSPVADMTVSGLKLGDPSKEAMAAILAYLGCDDIATCDDAKEASPLFDVSAASVPTFLVVGSDELVPREQVETLHTALESAGVPTGLVVVPGDKHGQSLMTSETRSEMLQFLEEWL
jgi:acetyl esterase